MSWRYALAAVAALSAATPVAAQPSAEYGSLSWGKTGISYLQYRTDAIECASEGVFAVLPETSSQFVIPPPVINPVATSGAQNAAVSGGVEPPSASDMIMSERLRYFNASQEARLQRQAIVDTCLLARGYTPFTLTQAQREELRQLERGSPARREFLYTLAIDANVLTQQALGMQ